MRISLASLEGLFHIPVCEFDTGRQLALLYVGNQKIDAEAIDMIVVKTEHTSAAFIQELMRRATQYAIVRGTNQTTSDEYCHRL